MNLVINSQFRPFTYDEMVKPLVQYKEVYDKLEQDYSNLASQTETWRDAVTRGNNPKAYSKFKDYATELSTIMDDFSKGLNISNRKALLGMKRRYSSEIEPIAKASKKIEELSAEQRKLLASNPDLMYDRDFSEVSIDEMMDNPNMTYRAVDGKDLYAKGQAITKAMASRIHNTSPALRNQYFEIKQGFGEEAANKFLVDSGAIPELNTALEGLVKSSGVTDKNRDRAFEYARQGAISGMVSSTSYQSNRGYESPADAAKRRDAHELFEVQMGRKPYREDADGTKHYVNSVANTTWSVDKDGTVTLGEKPKGSAARSKIDNLEDRLVPDTAIGGTVLKDTKNPSHKYIKNENGEYIRLSAEELKVMGKDSSTRINAYKESRIDTPNPSEIGMFKVDGKGNLHSLSRESDISNYESMYNNMGKNTVRSVSDYLKGNTNSDAAKAIKAAIAGTPLTLEDIEIVSNAGYKGWLSDENILIRVKDTNSSSSNRAQATSR